MSMIVGLGALSEARPGSRHAMSVVEAHQPLARRLVQGEGTGQTVRASLVGLDPLDPELSPEERANTGLMAPSHALREDINAIVRERLVRDGAVHGPAMNTERLVSRGYTNAEKTLAANYRAGDVVAFHRPYKRLGVEKGDELRVAGVDHKSRTVMLDGKGGEAVAWAPNRLAVRSGGVEVYRSEDIELRAGDRIRWTRNDTGLGLVNSQTAEVATVRDGRVTFRLEDGRWTIEALQAQSPPAPCARCATAPSRSTSLCGTRATPAVRFQLGQSLT